MTTPEDPRPSPTKHEAQGRVTSRFWDSTPRPPTCRGASLPAPALLGSKRALPGHDLASTSADATFAGVSPEENLRRKHRKTFEFKPADQIQEVQVKDEPLGDATTSIVPILTQLDAFLKPTEPSSSTPAGSDAPAQSRQSASTPSREEDAVITTLAHVEDPSVTVAIVSLVLRWARGAPKLGNEDDLGIAYLRDVIFRLDNNGVAPERRAMVIEMLREQFIKHAEELKSRLETLSAPQPSVSPSKAGTLYPNRNAYRSKDPTDVDSATSNSLPSSDKVDITHDDMHREPNRQRSHPELTEPNAIPQHSPAKSLASTTSAATRRNKPFPKVPFDLFLESALTARDFAPDEESGEAEFRKHAMSVWRKRVKAGSKQMDEWQELLRIRRTCTDVSAEVRELLESQDVLMEFVPDYHLRTRSSRRARKRLE